MKKNPRKVPYLKKDDIILLREGLFKVNRFTIEFTTFRLVKEMKAKDVKRKEFPQYKFMSRSNRYVYMRRPYKGLAKRGDELIFSEGKLRSDQMEEE